MTGQSPQPSSGSPVNTAELERRGHTFCRDTDDCNSYVRSERAEERVMDSVERFLDERLKRKVNRKKSAVAKPQERKFLGFSFTSGKELIEYRKGWLGYFRLIRTPTVLKALDSWIRRKLRWFVMKRWIKNCHTRYKGRQALGVSDWNARPIAASRKGPWAMSNMKPVKVAMPNRFFVERGLLCLSITTNL